MLRFREGGQDYIVRDRDTLAQLEAAWAAPRRELEAEEKRAKAACEDLERQGEQLKPRLEALKTNEGSAERRELERSIDRLDAEKAALERAIQQKRERGPHNNDVEVRALFRLAISSGKATPAN